MIYRVRETWEDLRSQIGAFTILMNAIKCCEKGYKVFDTEGRIVYFYPEPLGEYCPYSIPSLLVVKGNSGENVKWVQWQLVNLGFYCGVASIDGVFGNDTYRAVCNYQIAYNLDVDGIVGPQTINSLEINGKPQKPIDPTPVPISGFTPRLTIPEAGNKYYNTPAAGGYAVGAILGNPLQTGLNILANCVGYAAARFNEILGKDKWVYLQYPPNAEDFIDAARAQGLEITNTPSLGAIIVWAKGQTHYGANGAGHVAVVEVINEDGSIITSESGYGCANPFWTSKRYNDGNWGGGAAYRFIGFIKNPGVKEAS